MEERHAGGRCTPYFLAELRANLQAEDRIKARVLLSYFPTLDPSLQQRTLFELSRHTGDFAVALLGHLLANLERNRNESESGNWLDVHRRACLAAS